MEFKNTAVFNIEGALRGMRNPHNSWKHIDSSFGLADLRTIDEILDDSYPDDSINFENSKNNIILQTDGNLAEYAIIGPKDLGLAQKLIKAGPEHRKFLRQIFVSVDITAPLYW